MTSTRNTRRGQGLAEYALVVVLISFMGIAFLSYGGGWVDDRIRPPAEKIRQAADVAHAAEVGGGGPTNGNPAP